MTPLPRRSLLAAAALGSGLRGANAATALRLRFPGGRDDADARYEVMESLLQLALSAVGQPVAIERVMGMSQRRAIADAQIGQLDVSLVPTSLADTGPLQVLRVPLRRGLLGLRLLLASRELAPRLSPMNSVEELQGLRMGYGADWDDLSIMRTLGFQVVTGDSYAGLFRMLSAGRFDWMHRGVNEIWAELDHPTLMPHGLVVVPRLALFYPIDDYFCVSPKRPELFALLKRGMARIQADGRYDRWFQARYGTALARAELPRRRVLHLTGYGVPPDTPLSQFDVVRLAPAQGVLRLP